MFVRLFWRKACSSANVYMHVCLHALIATCVRACEIVLHLCNYTYGCCGRADFHVIAHIHESEPAHAYSSCNFFPQNKSCLLARDVICACTTFTAFCAHVSAYTLSARCVVFLSNILIILACVRTCSSAHL